MLAVPCALSQPCSPACAPQRAGLEAPSADARATRSTLTFGHSCLAVVLLGLGMVAMWMHRAPTTLDQRRTMTRAQGALRPLVSAPTRPQGGGLNAASAAGTASATAAASSASGAASLASGAAAAAADEAAAAAPAPAAARAGTSSRTAVASAALSSAASSAALAAAAAPQPGTAADGIRASVLAGPSLATDGHHGDDAAATATASTAAVTASASNRTNRV